MCRQTFQVKCDGFFDIALSFFECFALRVAARKSGNRCNIAAFGSLAISHRSCCCIWTDRGRLQRRGD
jgi:hypothetical protein